MEVTMRLCSCLILLALVVQNAHAGFDEDMEALENELKQEVLAKTNQKSLKDMTTAELIKELQKDLSVKNMIKNMKKKSASNDNKKNVPVKKSAKKSLLDLSTEELIAEIQKDEATKAKDNLKKVSVKEAAKKSLLDMSTEELIAALKKDDTTVDKDKNSKREKFHAILAKKDVAADKTSDNAAKTVSKSDIAVQTVSKSDNAAKTVTKISSSRKDSSGKKLSTTLIDDTFKLFDKALLTIAELRRAAPNDAETQLRAVELLKQLTKVSTKKDSSAKKEKIQKKNVALLALLATKPGLKKKSIMLQKTADDELDVAQLLTALQSTSEEINDNESDEMNSLMEHKEAIDNHIKSIAKLSDELLKLVADDILKEANKEFSTNEKRDCTREEIILQADDTCTDRRSDCANLLEYCAEPAYEKKLQGICAKTCKYCEPCTDKWSKPEQQIKCKVLLKAGRCVEKAVANYCIKTCGYCKVHTPPRCSASTYGCCWDKQTVRVDKDGSNCPVCKDKYRFVCKEFKVDCGNVNIAGDFMRKHCPSICGNCNAKCRDDPASAYQCPIWKDELNWCKKRPNLMKHFCPVTCGIC